MISKIISGILIVVTVVLQLKHFWDGLHIDKSPEALKMLTELNINRSYLPYFGIATILVAVLVLFPKTFFIGNLLNALSIVMIMALALRAENYKIALMEIPFLLIPLVLIWLKHPLRS